MKLGVKLKESKVLGKVIGLSLGASLILAGCTTANEDSKDNNTNNKTKTADVLVETKEGNITSSTVIDTLIKENVLEEEQLLNILADDLLEKYYPINDKEIKQKEKELIKFQELIGGEVDKDALKENQEYVKSMAQIDKAMTDLVEVSKEDEDKIYDMIKDKYEVVDILVFGDEAETKGKELLSKAKKMDEKELESLIDKYKDDEEVNVDVMPYSKLEIPAQEDQLKNFNKKGDAIQNKEEGIYNALLLLSKEEIKREDIQERVLETARYEKVGTVVDIIKLMDEKHKDIKLSKEIKELMEEYESKEGETTGVQGEPLDEDSEGLIDDLIEEEENK